MMPTTADISQALLVAMLDRAAQGGPDAAADLDTLANTDPDDLARQLGDDGTDDGNKEKSLDPSYDPDHPEECCPSCGARLERGDDGDCNRCGEPWPEDSVGPVAKGFGQRPYYVVVTRWATDAGNVREQRQEIRDSGDYGLDQARQERDRNLQDPSCRGSKVMKIKYRTGRQGQEATGETEVKSVTKGEESKYPSKVDVRGDIKQVLLAAHGTTPAKATRQQVSNAALQYFHLQAGWFQDRIAFRDYVIKCIKDWLDKAGKSVSKVTTKDISLSSRETVGDDPVAAGLAVVADDTGRVLLIQRQLDEHDPNQGKFEFPGGKVEDGLSTLETACKEWTEEVGLPLPDGKLTGRSWTSSDGKYQGFVYRVPVEADVPIQCRRGDADPESGGWAAVAWVDPNDLPTHNLRPALLENIDDVLAQVTKWLAGQRVIRKGWRRLHPAKGWRKLGPPHLSQTIDGVELRLANSGNHMDGGKWRLGVVGEDGKVSWRHDGKTRAEVEERVPHIVEEELGNRRQRKKSVRCKAACKPGQTVENTGCTPSEGGSGSPSTSGVSEKPVQDRRLEDYTVHLPQPSKAVGEKLEEIEPKMVNISKERGVFLSSEGRVLTDKTGSRSKVVFDDDEPWAKEAVGGVMTHSHGDSYLGLSWDDAISAAAFGLAEVRAVTPDGVHRLQPGPDGWPSEKKIKAVFKEGKRTGPYVGYDLYRMSQELTSEQNQRATDYLYNIWTVSLFDRLGLKYGFERHKRGE